jgi:hypothetical protein
MCNVSWLQIIAPDWIHGYQQLTEYLPVIQNGYLEKRHKSAAATDRWHLPEYKRYTCYSWCFKIYIFFKQSLFPYTRSPCWGCERACAWVQPARWGSARACAWVRVSVSGVLQFEIRSVFHESLCHCTTLLPIFSFCTVTKTRKTHEFTQLERY